MTDLSTPQQIQARLTAIDEDLAVRCNVLERAARTWYCAKRDREHDRAVSFITAVGTVAERNAMADAETSRIGRDAEAEFEAIKAVVRVLETRANIGMSLLRSQGRA
jgi:hypothetical protein